MVLFFWQRINIRKNAPCQSECESHWYASFRLTICAIFVWNHPQKCPIWAQFFCWWLPLRPCSPLRQRRQAAAPTKTLRPCQSSLSRSRTAWTAPSTTGKQDDQHGHWEQVHNTQFIYTATRRATELRRRARASWRRSLFLCWTTTARPPDRRRRRRSSCRPARTRTRRPMAISSRSRMWPTRTVSSRPVITSRRRRPSQIRFCHRCSNSRPRCRWWRIDS